MKSINKAYQYLFNKKYRFGINNSFGMYNCLTDKQYLEKRFKITFGYDLNLENPKTFNEKMQWLKLYNRNPIYTDLVDKYKVKSIVQDKIGSEYIIPTISQWDTFNDIDFNSLPSQFVLKTNHDSGTVILCRDKALLNKSRAKKRIEASLKRNYYLENREWPYKNVNKCIICEEYISDIDDDDLKDYKFFCFNGVVNFFKIDFNRFTKHQANYYDLNGELLPFGEAICPPDFEKLLQLPQNFEEMINIAQKLSQGFPFVRVDLYNVNGHIYFGELTFYPASGFGQFIPEVWDLTLGDMITLPN